MAKNLGLMNLIHTIKEKNVCEKTDLMIESFCYGENYTPEYIKESFISNNLNSPLTESVDDDEISEDELDELIDSLVDDDEIFDDDNLDNLSGILDNYDDEFNFSGDII